MHVSPAKHSYAWLPIKCDYRTDRRTDRHRTKWSLCAAMLCRRHKNVIETKNPYIKYWWTAKQVLKCCRQMHFIAPVLHDFHQIFSIFLSCFSLSSSRAPASVTQTWNFSISPVLHNKLYFIFVVISLGSPLVTPPVITEPKPQLIKTGILKIYLNFMIVNISSIIVLAVPYFGHSNLRFQYLTCTSQFPQYLLHLPWSLLPSVRIAPEPPWFQYFPWTS